MTTCEKMISRLLLVSLLIAIAPLNAAAGPVGPAFDSLKEYEGDFNVGLSANYDDVPLRARANIGNDLSYERFMFLGHFGWMPTERSELFLLAGLSSADLIDDADGVSLSPSQYDGRFDGIAGAGGRYVLWIGGRKDLRLILDAQMLMQNNIGLLESGVPAGAPRRSVNYDSFEWHTGLTFSKEFYYHYRPYIGVRASGMRLNSNTPSPVFGNLEQRNQIGGYGGVTFPWRLGRDTILNLSLEGRFIDSTGISLHGNFLF